MRNRWYHMSLKSRWICRQHSGDLSFFLSFSFFLSLSLSFFASASYLFKNNQLLSCQLWLKIDCHLCQVPRPGKSPAAPPQPPPPPQPPSINCNKSRRHREPLKGLTEAKGPVHRVRRRSNLCARKDASPPRPPFGSDSQAAGYWCGTSTQNVGRNEPDDIEVTTHNWPQFARKLSVRSSRGLIRRRLTAEI